MLECACTVPFGMPVEPEEYSQKQASSRVVGAGASFASPFASTSSNDEPVTITCLRNGSFSSTGLNCGSSASDTTSALARLSASMYS